MMCIFVCIVVVLCSDWILFLTLIHCI